MSTIPNSAMPHAGGTSSDMDSSSSSSDFQNAGDTSFSDEGSRWDKTELMERAREHKTGIALGVAAGAIAAAAIPFMLSGRKNSSERGSSSRNKSGGKSKSPNS